jgi:hypothetical protein
MSSIDYEWVWWTNSQNADELIAESEYELRTGHVKGTLEHSSSELLSMGYIGVYRKEYKDHAP